MADYAASIKNHIHLFQQPEAFLPFDNPSFRNPPFNQTSYRVLIVRLSPFRDVDRSTPHLFLFQEVRRALDRGAIPAFVDLAFFPPRAEREWFTQSGIPLLIGSQSLRSADEFDLVLVSNSYTLELINLPYLLLRSGIPLWASQRGPEWPLFILGGSNAMAAQAIVAPNGDCLADALFFGEGEGLVGQMVEHLASDKSEIRRDRTNQKQALARWMNRETSTATRAAARMDGLWVAGTFYPVHKAVIHKPDPHFLLTDAPLMNGQEARTAHLQINYGCPAFCSFCFEGYDRKPYRELSLSDLLQAARQIKQAQGCEELNLYSFNLNTHSDILELLAELNKLFDRVGLKSQRVDLLQRTDLLLEAEIWSDKRSLTLGIEGISARQRAWLHKSLPTDDITGLLHRLFEIRVREIKLFYLLTGHETEEDVAEFRSFIQEIKEMRRKGGSGRVIFSFGLLIRMPFTPLRHDRLILDPDEWKGVIGPVKSACETNGFEFRLAFDWPAYCTSQVLALGGPWLWEPLVTLARQGFYFDTFLPEAYWTELQAWMKQAGHWNEAFLGEKGPDYAFPLEFVQTGLSTGFLYRQFQACRRGVDEGYCLGDAPLGGGQCMGCGACADDGQRQAIGEHHIHQPARGPYLSRLQKTVADKRQLKPVYVRLQLDPRWIGGRPPFVDAMVFKGLLDRFPVWTDHLLAVRESLFTTPANARRFPPMGGETVFALKAWDTALIEKGCTEIYRDLNRDTQKDTLCEPPCHPTGRPEILGLAEGFTPGEYTRLSLDMVLPAAHLANARGRLEAYLRGEHLPYALRREGEQYWFDVPKPGLKKKIVLGGWFETAQDGFHAHLEVGPKFDLLALLEGFGGRGLHHLAHIICSGIAW